MQGHAWLGEAVRGLLSSMLVLARTKLAAVLDRRASRLRASRCGETRSTMHLIARSVRSHAARLGSAGLRVACVFAVALSMGCASYSRQVQDARSALDQGRPAVAAEKLSRNLGVSQATDIPDKVKSDKAVTLLSRGALHQRAGNHAAATADLMAADKAIEILDFSKSSAEELGKFLFSDDTGVYRAPVFEKLMINPLALISFWGLGNMQAARVEARRFGVAWRYARENSNDIHMPTGCVGLYLSMATFIASGRPDEAETFRRAGSSAGCEGFARSPKPSDALIAAHTFPITDRCAPQQSASEAIQDTATTAESTVIKSAEKDEETGERPAAAAGSSSAAKPADPACGYLLLVGLSGRIPAKIEKRIHIGLALSLGAFFLSPMQSSTMQRLGAQGLVTWINYPELEPQRFSDRPPRASIDNIEVPFHVDVSLAGVARAAWDEAKGKVIAAAIVRMVTRAAIGIGVEEAVGGIWGLLLNLGGQAAMSATDTPDTRSFWALPAGIHAALVHLPVGHHEVVVGGYPVAVEVKARPPSLLLVVR